MRILRIADIPKSRNGGMARYIHFVSDELLKEGHIVDHIFTEDLWPDRRPWPRLGRFVTPFRAARAVVDRIRSGLRYDVVEIHEPSAARYAWLRRRNPELPPLLVTVYGLEARSRLARIAYGRLKGRPLSPKSRIAPLTIVWQANYALRRADHVSVETSEDFEYLRSHLGVPAGRITLQQGGVSADYFTTAPTARPGSLLYVGTWLERKGILDLVPAVTEALRKFPEASLTVAGAGCPDERVGAAFPEDVRLRVRIAPHTTDDRQLAELYRSHSVFVLPSTFEGLPLVLLEAAAAGLAIVTTPICGMRDVIRHDENGLLVPVGDSGKLAESLCRLLADPALANRLGAAACETVRAFTWKRSATQFLEAAEFAVSHSAAPCLT